MFKVELLGQQTVTARFDAMPGRVHSALLRRVEALTQNLQAHVVNDKLQGQVLQHRTGKLSRSIEKRVVDSPGHIIGLVFANGTAPYAHRFEFGWHGEEKVKAYTRVYRSVYDSKNERTFAQVKAFTRKANQPARSFLRSAMADQVADIEKSLIEAVTTAAGAV